MFCLPSVAQDKPRRLLGADISMLPKYEEKNTVYRDADGKAVDALSFSRRADGMPHACASLSIPTRLPNIIRKKVYARIFPMSPSLANR